MFPLRPVPGDIVPLNGTSFYPAVCDPFIEQVVVKVNRPSRDFEAGVEK
jgi:hypothetical protein